MFCPNCGTENANDAVFCENCGAKLEAAPGFAVPNAPAAAPSEAPAAPAKTRWPIILPIFMGAAFLIEVYFFFAYLDVVNKIGFAHYSMVFTLISNLLTVGLIALAAVLFILPTRNRPFLTAIPRIVMIALTVASIVIAAVGRNLNENAMPVLGMGIIAAVFYIIDTAARPRGKALAILHLIFAALSSVGGAVGSTGVSFSLGTALDLVQALLMSAAWCIALFAMERKKKA